MILLLIFMWLLQTSDQKLNKMKALWSSIGSRFTPLASGVARGKINILHLIIFRNNFSYWTQCCVGFFSKLVLRIKLNEGMKRSLRKTKPGKEPKAKQKKNKQKIDSKKPKKPPTAFFYFLYIYFYLPLFFIYSG